MGQSSFGGGSLKRASLRNAAARCLHRFLCFGQWFRWHIGLQYLTSIHGLHIFRLAPPSTPQSAQLIDCIVNAVCRWVRSAVPPPPPCCGVEARSEFVAVGERSVWVRERRKSRERQSSPHVWWERMRQSSILAGTTSQEEDSPLQRNNNQQQGVNAISMSANKKLGN